MGLARAAGLPVVVVGDIDRGGVLAHLFGTVAVLEPEDQALIAGFVINKFRGDPALLEPGLDQLAALTGRPTFRGVLPYSDELWLDTEDSLSLRAGEIVGSPAPPLGSQSLRVAAVRLPRISTPPTSRRWRVNRAWWCAGSARPAISPTAMSSSSRAVRPPLPICGGCASVDWPRPSPGTRAGKVVLGLCGGFQMMCRRIDDEVEGRSVDGLGLLDADIVFEQDKTVRRWPDTVPDDALSGYEIHHGQVTRSAEDTWFEQAGQVQGYRRHGLFGTHWHRIAGQRRLQTGVADAGGAGRRPARLPGGCRRQRAGAP